MTVSEKVTNFLNSKGVNYEIIEHPAAYTAQEIADKAKLPGKEVIKAVIIKADEKYIMCVLPAIHMVDMDSIKHISGANELRLATENEIGELFPDYELGAEPPFGEPYGIDIFIDKFLENDDDIVFNAGTHTDMIKMSFQDYLKVANPVNIVEIGVHV